VVGEADRAVDPDGRLGGIGHDHQRADAQLAERVLAGPPSAASQLACNSTACCQSWSPASGRVTASRFGRGGSRSAEAVSTFSSTSSRPAGAKLPKSGSGTPVAVTPDGKQVWVAETGPQTSPSSPSGVSVISTASDTVTAHLPIGGQPSQVTFSPDGATAYVVTADGLWVFSTATDKPAGVIRGLGDPRGIVVSPDGRTLYV
jgi:YVTN family beta-propeller protein